MGRTDAARRERPVGPVLMVLGSMVSLQFGAAVAKNLFDDIGAAGASALRLALAAVVLLLWQRPDVRSWSRTERRNVVLLGITLAAMNTAFYEAVSRIPLGAAITIEFLGPLGLAAVLSRRLREVGWVLLAVAGVGVLAWGQHGGGLGGLDPIGVVAALVAAAFWAAYIVVGARVATAGPHTGGLAASCTVAAALVLPYGVAVSGRSLLDARVLAVGLVMAVLASVIPYTLELRALRDLARRTFSILTALEPAIGALVGFVVLGQRLHPVSLIGMALVVAAGVGATTDAADEGVVLLPESS